MSGQRQAGEGAIERAMDAAPDGDQIDLQEVANSVNSGQVEAEEQPAPQDELRPGNDYARDRAAENQPS